MYAEGWTTPQISQALRLHASTILRHLKDYQVGKLKNRSGGSSEHLTPEQAQSLIAHLETHLYQCAHAIMRYVKVHYGVSYTLTGMHKWLHRHGFSYKKPAGKPYQADVTAQQRFIETYQKLKASVRDEPIVFIDAVHPTQATKCAYGWIKTGKRQPIPTTASRSRLNIMGAIQLGQLASTQVACYDTINHANVVDFMHRIRQRHGDKTVHIILDQSGYHRTPRLTEAIRHLNIKLHFLPPYSPNLNPIERLWKVMNERVRNNRFFKGARDFKVAIMDFFEHQLPRIGHTLNTRINDNFQQFKTEHFEVA